MKKLVSLVLALAMVALCIGAAVAAPTQFTTGSITVNNAAKGANYVAIKVMDAIVSDEGITYTGTIPSELEGIVDITEITANGHTYQAIGKVNDPTVATADYVAALRKFAKDHYSETYKETATSNTVTFSNLPVGFYVIVSSLNDKDTNKVMACSTFNADVTPHTAAGTVVEKNTTDVVVHKNADESFSIGDTVEYTVDFTGANYRQDANGNLQIVTKYRVSDTLPAFLSGAAITKVKIGDDVYEGSDLTNEAFPGVASFGTNKYFDIPWSDGSHAAGYTSKYPNGTLVTITYTATLTNIVKVDGTDGNKNVVTIKPYVDTDTGEEEHDDEWDAHDEIFTYGAALKKVDGANTEKTLAGAKFQFKGLTLNTISKGVYEVDSLSGTDYGTEVEVGDDGILYIIGLGKDVTLTGKETVAPAGYNLLTDEFELEPQILSHEVWTAAGTNHYDADWNLVSSTSSYTNTKDVDKTIDDLEPAALKVINNAGTELPHTGGIGTTIFYILGGLLVIGAAVILVARRKAQD